MRGSLSSLTYDFDRGNDFSSNTIGIAYLNTMCGSASVGIVLDSHRSAQGTGSTFAHEMGHLFGIDHDDSRAYPTQTCARNIYMILHIEWLFLSLQVGVPVQTASV